MPKRKRNMRRERNDRDRNERKPYGEEKTNDSSAKNDISWYSRYPELLVAAGSFPFPYRPGMNIDLGSTTGSTVIKRQLAIPGVMCLSWAPSIGVSNDATSPASVAAKEIYAKVRSKYSGALDADAPDFMVYLMALDSIFAYIAWMKRIYRTLNAWTPNNYVLPDVVLSAMGLRAADITTLRSEKTLLWQCINELVLQSRKFTCPALMDIFNRHYWMSDNVYTDENSINSQFYIFNLRSVYKYADLPIDGDTAGNTAAGLITVDMPWVGGGATAAKLLKFGLDLIQALVSWDDAYTINGYLMRAYEGAPSFVVAEIMENEVLTPVYEEEVLVQIENSRTLPTVGYAWNPANERYNLSVTQNVLKNVLVSNPKCSISTTYDQVGAMSEGGYTLPPMLSIRSDNPSVADSVVASRLQALVLNAERVSVGEKQWVYDITFDCGTEIPIGWHLYTQVWDSSAASTTNPQYIEQTPVVPTSVSTSIPAQMISIVEQFDWHPFIWLTSYTINAFNGTLFPAGDTHNITTITPDALKNLHRVCLFSEFNSFSIA